MSYEDDTANLVWLLRADRLHHDFPLLGRSLATSKCLGQNDDVSCAKVPYQFGPSAQQASNGRLV